MARFVSMRARVVVGLAIAFVVAGCAKIPSGRFATFADASRSLADGSTNTYGRIVALQHTYMLYNPSGEKLSATSFDPVIVDDEGNKRDFDFRPRLEFRTAALEVLAAYADALHAFAAKDYSTDLDEATQKLGASVATLAARAGNQASAAQAGGVLAAAVNGLGNAAIEYIRKDTLRTAMTNARPGVEQLAGLIASDNESIALAVRVMRGGIIRKANTLRPPVGIQRLAFDESVAATIDDADVTLVRLDQMNLAVAKIPKAHAEILESLERGEGSLANLQAVVAEAKRLNKYYRASKNAYEGKD